MSSSTGILRVAASPPVQRVHFLIRDLQPGVCSWSTGDELPDKIRTEIRIDPANKFILELDDREMLRVPKLSSDFPVLFHMKDLGHYVFTTLNIKLDLCI